MVSHKDIQIIISMTICIIAISFVFPPLGFAADNVQQSDIPNFTATSVPFQGIIDRPERPGYPARGTLNRSSDQFDSFPGHFEFNFGPGTSTEDVFLVVQDFNGEVRIVNDTQIVDNHTFTSNGEEHEIVGDGFSFLVHANNITIGEYEYVVLDRPTDNKWYDAIPLLGGIVSGAEQVAAVVGWIGSWIGFAIQSVVITSFEILVLIFDIIVFLFSLMSFVVTTYFNVVTNSPEPWVGLFLLIPGILLSFTFARLALAGIDYVPFVGR